MFAAVLADGLGLAAGTLVVPLHSSLYLVAICFTPWDWNGKACTEHRPTGYLGHVRYSNAALQAAR